MVHRIIVPQLDANMVDVTVTAWLKQVGDQVKTGDIIAEVTTDKAAFEIESTATGTLLELLAIEKSIVPAGYILALVGPPGAADHSARQFNDMLLAKSREDHATAKNTGTAATALESTPKVVSSRVRATPRARRLAQQHGLDLAGIQAKTGVEVIDEATILPFIKTT
jgi:pyruvate dehydrogenase E2 component (dihydrolipoamide acetyltransferase)